MESKLKSSSGLPIMALASVVTLIAALAVWRSHEFAALLFSAVNALDYRAILFLNRFAHRSWTFDTFVYVVDSNPFATAPLLMAVWWAWFKDVDLEAQRRTREILLHGILGCYLVLVMVRLAASALPYRARPLHNPELSFVLPYSSDPRLLLGWSSMPSDHAILWFAVATAIFFVSRRVGIFLFAYISLTLCLARIYLGIHYPSDIIMGGLIGAGMACLCQVDLVRKTLAEQPLRWLQRSPGLFYAGMFMVTCPMLSGFGSVQDLQSFAHATLKAILHRL
jgi:undecaprenyl-diphosphatase